MKLSKLGVLGRETGEILGKQMSQEISTKKDKANSTLPLLFDIIFSWCEILIDMFSALKDPYPFIDGNEENLISGRQKMSFQILVQRRLRNNSF